ncbi:hypothetical protein BB561_004437 [Smittium simulii]|uniref:DNA-directed RNA polymerase III subunit RPC6 n=1 Tax=Smittium simulii TaxID=133385 RepID=A0A2T9YGC2_9FUNG|nr:hypothetical protein BB561_004437 [Smittium simulii]
MDNLTASEKQFYKLASLKENGVDLEEIQTELIDVSIEDVAKMVNKMTRLGLLEICQTGSNKFTYRAVKIDQMAKMESMEPEEILVYKQIMASSDQGIWVRSIKTQTNLHQQVVTKYLKILEGKNLIKSVKSVKNPTKKLYMLIDIKPSTEISGGPWFTDQELDVDFIEQLTKQCFRYIYSKSINKMNPSAIYHAGHYGYPTAIQIKKFIIDNKISTIDLSLEDITSLLDMLVYDEKIERLLPFVSVGNDMSHDQTEWVYRAITTQAEDSPLSEIPCGNCPVYKQCSEDGQISPGECPYFKKWLNY